MVAGEISRDLLNQLHLVINTAREKFADRCEEEAGAGRINTGPISEADKQVIEILFSEVVYSYIVAEMAAFVTSLIYSELKDSGMVCRITPAFMDEVESTSGHSLECSMAKTKNLRKLTSDILEFGGEKSDIVNALLQDITGMSPLRPMRASYDAVMLNLLGE